jgi:DHA1 family bicyclomycin/chloramphenicol resistance-like MFS transporter
LQTSIPRLAVVLGLITAVGPFAIDMYLPAMPSMGATLNASAAMVQLSLMAFFVTIGICQLIYGPLADIHGRKLPVYGGLVIFAAGSLGCALAPNVEVLIGFRIVQAFGSCAGMVVPRAIVRDLYTGHEATKLMSLLMLVVSVSPLLAPLTGSLIIAHVGWRGVFAVLTVAGLLSLALAVTLLDETRPAAERAGSSWSGAFRSYAFLLRDRVFVGLTLVGSFGISAFFVFLGSASFVLINHYGLTPMQFSLCFALNAAAFFGVSQLTATFVRRFGLVRVIRAAALGFATAMLVLGLLFATLTDSLVVMLALLFIGYGFLGLVLPTTGVMALEAHGEVAGAASALMGALQMVVGAVAMALASLASDGTPKPMVLGIAGCALAAVTTVELVLGVGARKRA